MDFEQELEKVIEEYGAPEYESEVIREFLYGAGNIYSICSLWEDCNKDEDD